MTWENGHSLPVLCLILSQNRMTRHEICNVPVEKGERKKKVEGRGREGKEEEGMYSERKVKMERREGKREGMGRRKDKVKRGKMYMCDKHLILSCLSNECNFCLLNMLYICTKITYI